MEFTGPKPTGPSRQSKIVTERRNSVRLAVQSPAYTSLNGLPPEKARDLSEIMDIGESGMSIQTSSPLEVDRNLDLCLDLSETKTRIGTTGRVVWSNRTGRAGIRFQNLTGQSLRELREWLFVNVLTAFDHARSRTAPEVTDATNGDSKGPRLSQAVPRALQISGCGMNRQPGLRKLFATLNARRMRFRMRSRRAGNGCVRSSGCSSTDCRARSHVHSRYRGCDRIVRGRRHDL